MIRNRQMEILLHLLKVKHTTHRELATLFEVSIKTIQRDIDALSTLGIPITCKQGKYGGIYIEESYKLSRSLLTNEDLQSITIALTMYDAFSTTKHKDQVMKKLALIAPELVYLYEQDATDYFIVDILPEKIDMTNTVFTILNKSLDEEYYVNITIARDKLKIAPISYVLRSDGLYLYAFHEEYLLLKTSDIISAELTNEEYSRNFISYRENKSI
ncbi:helix-turn-helix transcriptional regulator [Sporosarcina obsidiansis]|uniref:helix-turn-helix transcriptional regulator n=1 Tax=Sporosarcina obsidiansis TaxID=2660748 RepID=UPI0018910255|nr:HTH domain-containing protein [Sporosarcina obsidiansis]